MSQKRNMTFFVRKILELYLRRYASRSYRFAAESLFCRDVVVCLKFLERFLFKQMSNFFDEILSNYQCGFRKGFSGECLIVLLKKWKRVIDIGEAFGVLLTDLSKVFNCLDHELLVAKLNVNGFSLMALKLVMVIYPTENKKQKYTFH